MLALRALLTDPSRTAEPVEVELHVDGQVLTVAVGPGGRQVRSGPATSPVATVTGDGTKLLAVASGMQRLEEAGVEIGGQCPAIDLSGILGP